MNPDWNIVDDSAEQPPLEAKSDDSRLDAERIRRITRDRRAADRIKLWRTGIIATVLLATAIVIARVTYWVTR